MNKDKVENILKDEFFQHMGIGNLTHVCISGKLGDEKGYTSTFKFPAVSTTLRSDKGHSCTTTGSYLNAMIRSDSEKKSY